LEVRKINYVTMPTLREKYPIRYRKILKKSTIPVLRNLLISVPLAFVYFLLIDVFGKDWSTEKMDQSIYILFFSAFCFIFYVPFIEFLYFLTYFYDSDSKNVIIRKGIIARKEVTLPYTKITDVYVEQDFLDVILRIYFLHISTPTAESGKIAHIAGLDKKGSKAMREYILGKVNEVHKVSEGNEVKDVSEVKETSNP
jgi:uncharacterized membrane protein YdbT with pleckstrin-like domain